MPFHQPASEADAKRQGLGVAVAVPTKNVGSQPGPLGCALMGAGVLTTGGTRTLPASPVNEMVALTRRSDVSAGWATQRWPSINTLPWVPPETAPRQMSAMHTCAVTVCDGPGRLMTTLTPGSPPMALQRWDHAGWS